jgi:hypothetical protein
MAITNSFLMTNVIDASTSPCNGESPQSSMNIPPTQFAPQMPVESPMRLGEVLFESPALFTTIESSKLNDDGLNDDGLNDDERSRTIDDEEKNQATPELQFSGHEAVILPPTDDEANPFADDHELDNFILHPPSAMKKSNKASVNQRRVKFAISPKSPSTRSDDSILRTLEGISSPTPPLITIERQESFKKDENLMGSLIQKSPPIPTTTLITGKRSRNSKKQIVPQSVYIPKSLTEQMLVWARWRPHYYAPAVLQNRASRTRELWRIFYCHWRDASQHRSVTLPGDQLSPCDMSSLQPGDRIFIVRNRRKMDFNEGMFERWLDVGHLEANIEGRMERVDLTRIIIDRIIFQNIHNRLQSESSSSIVSLSQEMRGMIPTSSNQSSAKSSNQSSAKSSNQSSAKSSNQPSVRTSPMPRKKCKKREILKGYSFMISLGSLSVTQKRTQKSQLITRIRSLGGQILSDDAKVPKDNVILLSNGYCRTAKTSLALVKGLPVLRLDWLEACEQAWEFSSLQTFAVPIPGRVTMDKLDHLLDGWSIALVGSPNFVSGWRPVLMAAGANLVEQDHINGSTDMVRMLMETLPSRSSRLGRWTISSGVMVVTVDWLISSILSGCAV